MKRWTEKITPVEQKNMNQTKKKRLINHIYAQFDFILETQLLLE